MFADKNGKAKKPVMRLTVQQFVTKKSKYAGSAENDEIRHNVNRHCVHHETVLLDETNKAHTPLIGIPAIKTHHITWKRDENSKRVSLKTFVPIYGNWPLGRNRGEDPRGDMLMDMLVSMHKDYCDWLDANPAIKKKIFLATDQTCALTAPAADHVISPVLWEKYPAKHELFGEINPDKSPEFKVMMWDMEVKPGSEIRPDDLLFDENNKKIITCITDDRQKKAVRVTKEPHMKEFTYEAGEYKRGKFPFMMFVQMKLLNPTVFWESKRPAVFQIKATDFWVRETIVSDGANAVTPDERAEMDREAEEAAAYYGIAKRPASEPLDDTRDTKKPCLLSPEEAEFERQMKLAQDQ